MATPQGGGGDAAKPDSRIGGNPDAAPGTPDAPLPVPDAPGGGADAAPNTITLSQTTSAAVVPQNSVSCNGGSPLFITAENSYYRAFTLSDHGVNSAFNVTRVDFTVESAISGNGVSQPGTVKLYSYAGSSGGTTLNPGQMTQIGGVAVTIPDGDGITVTANVAGTVPAGGTLVAELFIPDGNNDLNTFFIGSNASGESKPGYIRAPDCMATTPTALQSLGLPTTVDILLTATGTYNP